MIRKGSLGHMVYARIFRSQSKRCKYKSGRDVISDLICPICKKHLSVYEFKSKGDKIEYGMLFCEKCSRYFPIGSSLIGVPEVVPDKYRDFSKDFMFIQKWEEKIPKEVLEVASAQQRRSDKNE